MGVGGTSAQAHDLKSDDGAPTLRPHKRIRLLLAGGDVKEANVCWDARTMTDAGAGSREGAIWLPYREPRCRARSDVAGLTACNAAHAHVDGVRYKAAVNVGVAAYCSPIAPPPPARCICWTPLKISRQACQRWNLLAAPYEKVRRFGMS